MRLPLAILGTCCGLYFLCFEVKNPNPALGRIVLPEQNPISVAGPGDIVAGFYPVWSRYSCGALIELQQSTEAFLTVDATRMLPRRRNRGTHEQLIAFALVRRSR